MAKAGECNVAQPCTLFPLIHALDIFGGENCPLCQCQPYHSVARATSVAVSMEKWNFPELSHTSELSIQHGKKFSVFRPFKISVCAAGGRQRKSILFFSFISLKLKLKFSRKTKQNQTSSRQFGLNAFVVTIVHFHFRSLFILFYSFFLQCTPAALELKIHESWLIPPCEWLNLFSFSSLISISEKDVISLGLRRTHDDSEERTGKQLSTEEEALIENIELKQTSGIISVFSSQPQAHRLRRGGI